MLLLFSRVLFALLAFLLPAVAFREALPDFSFGISAQTTVSLDEQSIFEATINGKGPFRLFFDTGTS